MDPGIYTIKIYFYLLSFVIFGERKGVDVAIRDINKTNQTTVKMHLVGLLYKSQYKLYDSIYFSTHLCFVSQIVKR